MEPGSKLGIAGILALFNCLTTGQARNRTINYAILSYTATAYVPLNRTLLSPIRLLMLAQLSCCCWGGQAQGGQRGAAGGRQKRAARRGALVVRCRV